MTSIRCHSDVYGGGQVCPTTTTFPAECYSKYGGGRPTCDIPKQSVPTTVVTVPSKPPTTDLPFTGGDVVGLSLVGVLLLACGFASMRAGRRKARPLPAMGVSARDFVSDACPDEPHSHNGIGQCGTDPSEW